MQPFEHTDFARAFRAGEVFECPQRGNITVRTMQVAKLVLPSGRIVACDPAFLQDSSDFPPFTRSVAPGCYPVSLSLATIHYPNTTDERVACALIRFKRTKARTWETALLPNQDPSALPPDEVYGYGVDSGKGCFLDALAVAKLEPERQLYSQRHEQLCAQPHLIDLDAIIRLRTPFFRRLAAETIDVGRDWADLVIDPETGANLVVFRSGYGDGGYASYWGLDSGGEASCLVTDFGILVTPLEATVKLPLCEDRRQVVSHPDLEQMGLDSIRVLRSRNGLKVRLELQGRDCLAGEPKLESGRKTYHHRSGYSQGNVMEYTLEEPLPPKARLVIRYLRGVRAL